MRFFQLEIPGAFRIEVERREDERGFLARTFCVNEFGGQGLVTAFRQHSASFNRHKGTLRGLHYQVDPHAEVKLVRCTAGAVFDVLVDLRRSSPTFGRWHGEVLSADNHVMLYIPAGCAHGFQALSDGAELVYCHSAAYDAAADGALNPRDPMLAIAWPLQIAELSPRDSEQPMLDAGFTGVAL